MAKRLLPDDLRCVGKKANGGRCKNKRSQGDYCGKHSPKADTPDLDPEIMALAAEGWRKVQSCVAAFPAGSLKGAKDVMTAIMAETYTNGDYRQATSACRVLASLVQAEAAKLTAEKPITVLLGDGMAEDIGA